jgi:2-polyprenyl-6-methoxyphenol hydroxylase-like FAD-dependent oxidoreductase
VQNTTPTPHHDVRVDVLVVGAGPAGLTTGIALARHGIDVLVVEKHAGTSPFPKATAVSTRTMELLRSWGLERRVRVGAMNVRPLVTMSDTLVGPEQASMPFGYPTDDQALAVSPTTPAWVPQDHLEPVLRDHLEERGGHVRFDTELTELALDPAGVTARLRHRTTGRRYRVRARYVVGADGPRSSVRTALGIDVDDLGTIGEFVSVTFRADLTRRLPRIPSGINAVGTGAEAGLFVPTSTDDRWIYARQWCPENGDTLADWTPERSVAVLRTATGLPGLRPDILGVLPFVMGGHVATAFRAGRGFLVGDAAHRTTPVGGTGMNTAIHAAHNLGWKLAWVLRGWAHHALLDSYEAERRPIGTENVVRSLRRGPAPDGDGLACDIGVRYTSAVLDSDAGHRAPHTWIRHGGFRKSMLDLFDGRLTLLTGRRGEQWRHAATELAAGGIPITVLSADRDLHDEDGTFARHYSLGDTSAALVRPDGYLAWQTSEPLGNACTDLRNAIHLVLGMAAQQARAQAA